MPKRRTKIPDDLAAEVLFLADRTCCVCRDPSRNVEIHHIDRDATNNVLENLAVVCKDCHSDAHTTQAFSRNLTPMLLRKYNESWREIVRVRVNPGGIEGEALEYSLQVLLELYLESHRWKNSYTEKYRGELEKYEMHINDPWDYLCENAPAEYTQENWKYYKALFDRISPRVAERLETLVATYNDALSPRVKLQVFRTVSCLRNERIAYLAIPNLIEEVPEHSNIIFQRRFSDTLSALGRLARMADDERNVLGADRGRRRIVFLGFEPNAT